MRPSPIGAKILSWYAIVFAGIVPSVAMVYGLIRGPYVGLFGRIVFCAAIIRLGIYVVEGHYSATRPFAVLVILHYLGVTAAILWHFNDFPPDSRAAQLAVPRMLRGVIYAGVYAWYFLFRQQTAAGFFAENADGKPGLALDQLPDDGPPPEVLAAPKTSSLSCPWCEADVVPDGGRCPECERPL